MVLRVEWLTREEIDTALRLLTPANRLVMEVSISTGLRVGDVLALRSDRLRQRMTVRESKTGKSRRVTIPAALYDKVAAQAGAVWVFEGALDRNRHRTRQAVWKDLKRAAKAARIRVNAGPHSARKIYAVELYRRKGIKAAQAALNHDDQAVTLLYALADQLRLNGPVRGRRKSLTRRTE